MRTFFSSHSPPWVKSPIWDSNKMLVSLLQTRIDKIVSRAKMALKEGEMKAGSVILLLGSLKSLRFATTLATLPDTVDKTQSVNAIVLKRSC